MDLMSDRGMLRAGYDPDWDDTPDPYRTLEQQRRHEELNWIAGDLALVEVGGVVDPTTISRYLEHKQALYAEVARWSEARLAAERARRRAEEEMPHCERCGGALLAYEDGPLCPPCRDETCARCGADLRVGEHGRSCTACWRELHPAPCETCGGTGRIRTTIGGPVLIGESWSIPRGEVDCPECRPDSPDWADEDDGRDHGRWPVDGTRLPVLMND